MVHMRIVKIAINTCLAIGISGQAFAKSDHKAASDCGLNVGRGNTPQIYVKPNTQYTSGSFIGFNININLFEKQIWSANQLIKNEVINYLRELGPTWYRYPGGIQANNFNWAWAIGPDEKRNKQKIIGWQKSKKYLFGVKEYLDMLESLEGNSLIVSNLVGWNKNKMGQVLPINEIVASNRALSKYIKETTPSITRAYELGNELDRGGHQWSVEEYITKASAVAKVIKEEDPNATIIMPIREWDLTYRGREWWRGKSKGMDYTRRILETMPEINDFSFHYYYDPAEDDNGVFFHKGRLKMIERMNNLVRSMRKGKEVGIWVTEHARKWENKEQRHTSNLYSSISTSDFLIALTQIPEIKGVFWHELNGVHWKLFEIDKEHSLVRPRPIYWAFRILSKVQYKNILSSCTTSPFNSGYNGGYDVRSAVFESKDKQKLGLWVINRAPLPYKLKLIYQPLKNRHVKIIRYTISGNPIQDPDGLDTPIIYNTVGKLSVDKFDEKSSLELQVAPFSVSSFAIEISQPTH